MIDFSFVILLILFAIFVGIGCFIAPGIGLIIFFSIRKARSSKAEAAEVIETTFSDPDASENESKEAAE